MRLKTIVNQVGYTSRMLKSAHVVFFINWNLKNYCYGSYNTSPM